MAVGVMSFPVQRSLPVVLIVGDVTTRSSLKAGLDGYARVLEAKDGAQAVEILQERATWGIDLAIVDDVLPRQSGLEILHLTKRRWPSVPVVITTAVGSEELAIQALRAGASDYLKNPIEGDMLKATVRRLTTSRGEVVGPSAAIDGIRSDVRGMHPNVRRAILFLLEHFTQEITLADVARAAALSRFHFCRLFHHETGVSLHQYLNTLRVNRAKVLLADRYLRITEVAYAVGFNDLSHFDRVFRRLVSKSPREYRRSVAGSVGPPDAPPARTARPSPAARPATSPSYWPRLQRRPKNASD
jgi:YesN/AraC family two-component response regulator